MIRDLNLVSGPEYPDVSAALVIAVLVKAIDACGFDRPAIKLYTRWTLNINTLGTGITYNTNISMWFISPLVSLELLIFLAQKGQFHAFGWCNNIYHHCVTRPNVDTSCPFVPLSLCLVAGAAPIRRGHVLPLFTVISAGLTDTLPAAFISSRLAVWLNITSCVCLNMPEFCWKDFCIKTPRGNAALSPVTVW